MQVDYRQEPRLVKLFERACGLLPSMHWRLKKVGNPIHLSFNSKGFVSLRAALRSFPGDHERLFLCFACSIACVGCSVVSLLSLKVSILLCCMLYYESGYLFKSLAHGLSMVSAMSYLLLITTCGVVSWFDTVSTPGSA